MEEKISIIPATPITIEVKMEWISVKDRLPENDCICVVWNEKRPFQYYVSCFWHYCKEFEVSMIGGSRLNDPICFNATHWAVLRPPKDV